MHKTKFIAEPNTQTVILERTFNATADKLFDAYVNPDKLVKWWGGHMRTKVVTYEAHTGGSWRIVQADDSDTYGFRGVFHDVVPNERIILTFEFDGFKKAFLEATYFTEKDGKTTVKTVHAFQTVADRDEMIEIGMEIGCRTGFDILAELVES